MKDLNNHFEETDNTVNLTPCLEEVIDEIRVISYLVDAVGDSIGSTGVPSDPSLVNMALAQLSFKLSNVAEVLETVQSDLDSKDSEQAADLIPMVLKNPGSDPVLIMAEESVETLQSLVGGHFECCSVTEDIEAVFNENGDRNKMPASCTIKGYPVCGTVVFMTGDIEAVKQLIQS